jgi:hypothetical protein
MIPFPFQGPSNYAEIGIFGMKIYHLAALNLARNFLPNHSLQNLLHEKVLLSPRILFQADSFQPTFPSTFECENRCLLALLL